MYRASELCSGGEMSKGTSCPAFRPLYRRYDGQASEFGWAIAQGKSYFLVIRNYGIGWLHHPGPDRRTFQIFKVNG